MSEVLYALYHAWLQDEVVSSDELTTVLEYVRREGQHQSLVSEALVHTCYRDQATAFVRTRGDTACVWHELSSLGFDEERLAWLATKDPAFVKDAISGLGPLPLPAWVVDELFRIDDTELRFTLLELARFDEDNQTEQVNQAGQPSPRYDAWLRVHYREHPEPHHYLSRLGEISPCWAVRACGADLRMLSRVVEGVRDLTEPGIAAALHKALHAYLDQPARGHGRTSAALSILECLLDPSRFDLTSALEHRTDELATALLPSLTTSVRTGEFVKDLERRRHALATAAPADAGIDELIEKCTAAGFTQSAPVLGRLLAHPDLRPEHLDGFVAATGTGKLSPSKCVRLLLLRDLSWLVELAERYWADLPPMWRSELLEQLPPTTCERFLVELAKRCPAVLDEMPTDVELPAEVAPYLSVVAIERGRGKALPEPLHKLTADAFAGRPECWEIFERLAGTHTGTYAELIEATVALADASGDTRRRRTRTVSG